MVKGALIQGRAWKVPLLRLILLQILNTDAGKSLVAEVAEIYLNGDSSMVLL